MEKQMQEVYKSKLMSAHDAVKLVKDGETIIVGVGAGEPPTLLTALSDRRREFNNVSVAQILPLRKYDYFDAETVDNVKHLAYFINGPSRKLADEGYYDYLPGHFSEIPVMMRRKQIASDVVFAFASEMDAHGNFAISLGTDYIMEAIKHARVIILESNPNVPFTYGNCHINIKNVTAVVESNDEVISVSLPEISDVQKKIGKFVADLIPDEATLQIGFGGIPDAVVTQLTSKKNLGIHTEMIGDGILTLIESGAVTCSKKNYYPGKMFATFALGSKKLYSFMDRNPMLEMHPVEFTNDPYLIGKNDKFVSINATVQVDFLGQCCSESFGPVSYSGSGGQVDFVRGASRSEGGLSFIVLPSTAKGDTISRIQPFLTQGSHITTGKNDVGLIVTEYGVADLRGKTAHDRAKALINIAHPKFRDELTEEAKKLKFIR